MQLKINKIFTSVNKEKYGKYLELIPDFKKEKAQKFTTIVLTIVAVIILAIFAINPTLSTIANLNKQLEDARFVSKRLQDKINDLSILQSKFNSIQEDLPLIYESVPKKSEAPKITGQIQAIAQAANVTIISTQISNITQAQAKFYYLDFNITLTGSYENIINFIDQLSNSQRITYIYNVSITKGQKEGEALRVNVKGQAFFKE